MNYYNEFDPKAAAWLRELIKAGLIPPGDVDERSITEIKAHELSKYTQCHFFAGIGGWSLSLELAGWPADRPVWTGSCPCQPFSDAGKGLGTADERHLWPAFFRLIRERRPSEMFGEQVASKAALGWLDGVFADLEGEGYACGAADLCSASVGAPNIRQRLFWMANAGSEGREGPRGAAKQDCEQRAAEHLGGSSSLGGMVNSVEPRLEGHAGNVSDGNEPGRLGEDSSGSVAAAGGVGRVGDTAGGGCGERRDAPQSTSGGRADGPGIAVDWSHFNIAWCRDPRGGDPIPRRIEPGSFPMAARLSSRVGLLRGYGNAINPVAAAEFIAAAESAQWGGPLK